MRTIETLTREHEWIGWMATTLERLVARTKTDGRLPEEAYALLALYEDFADGRHQEKEETVLLPELVELAAEAEREVLQRLLVDHVAERELMVGMRASLLGAIHGERPSVQRFLRAAGEYVDLHRAHMEREGETLLPLARRILSSEADRRIARGFERIEGGPGDPHGVREQILALRKRVGLLAPPAA